MDPKPATIDKENMILSTDFYQITMIAAYYQYNYENNINEGDDICVFELFSRKLPKNRNYLVFAGLEQVLYYLLNARFSNRTIEYIRNRDEFKNIDSSFFDEYLLNFKFDLDVWALREGEIFFPNEPIIRVEGPSIKAQLAETYLLSVVNYQTIIASKAARIKDVAGDKVVLEFGTRRAHSPQAGIYAARASYIGGFDGTSNVTADLELGIKASGTMAHSFVQKFGEMESFRVYYDIYKGDTILLIDTYDIKEGTLKATKFGNDIFGVRIDSGDLAEEAKRVRKILDDNGCENIIIVLSSDLNEFKIRDILKRGVKVDAFGVGTELVTSRDDPSLGVVYKLMEHNGKPTIKISEGKITYPGKKQLYRFINDEGKIERDVLALSDEPTPPGAEPMLIPILERGNLKYNLPKLEEIRAYSMNNIKKLPDRLRKLEEVKSQKLEISNKLENLTASLINKYE
jgi:nicotinate phosphoribosyltransferase